MKRQQSLSQSGFSADIVTWTDAQMHNGDKTEEIVFCNIATRLFKTLKLPIRFCYILSKVLLDLIHLPNLLAL